MSTPHSLPAEQFHLIARALADPRRYEILDQIAAHSATPCAALREDLPISAATLSHHVKELETAGLIKTIRRGKFVDLIFDRETWAAYLAALQSIGIR